MTEALPAQNSTAWYTHYTQLDRQGRAGQPLPSHAGARNGRYDAVRSLYLPTNTALTKIRAQLAKAATGSLIKWTCVGDSRTGGYTVSTAASWPTKLRIALENAGIPIGGTGLVLASQGGGLIDTRYTQSGSWTDNTGSSNWTATGAVKTFTSDVPGTSVDIWVYNPSGTWTYSIDDGPAVTVAAVSSGTYNITTISGLPNSTHTVKVTSTSASGTFVGVNVYGTSGLIINNYGLIQRKATDGVDANLVSALGSNLVTVELGVNDLAASTTSSAYATALAAIIAGWSSSSVPLSLIAQTALPTNTAGWPAYLAAQYDAADANNAPLLDLADRWGSPTNATSLGLLTGDNLHESAAGFADIARAMGNAVATASGAHTHDYEPTLLPGAAGPRSGMYDPSRSLYQPTNNAMADIRAALSKAQSGELIDWFILGDSTAGGFGTEVGTLNSWPSQLRWALDRAGIPCGGTGLVWSSLGGTASGLQVDDRWSTTSGSWTDGYGSSQWTASGSTKTFVSDAPGTVVDVWYYSGSGSFTVAIDGGTPVAVSAVGAGTTYYKYTVTGLSNALHTVAVTSTSSAGTLIGVNVHGTSGLVIHNQGIVGKQAVDAVDTSLATALAPDIVTIELGINDSINGVTVANYATALTAQLAPYTGAAVSVVAQNAYQTTANSWPSFVNAQFNLADNTNSPLIDLSDRWGLPARAISSGYMQADGLHRTIAGNIDVARNIAAVVATAGGPHSHPDLPLPTAYSPTVTVDAALGDSFKITATGSVTLNPPANGTDGQSVMITVRASGATRTVTLSSSILLTTGAVTAVTPAAGKAAYHKLRYAMETGAWTLLAQTVEV